MATKKEILKTASTASSPAPQTGPTPGSATDKAHSPATASASATPAAPKQKLDLAAMNDFTAVQIEDIRETFSLFIKSSNGEISLGQCGDVMRSLGLNPTNADIFKVLGTSKSEELKSIFVDFETFLPMFHQVLKSSKQGKYEDFVEAIMCAELRQILLTLGERLSVSEVDHVLAGQEDMNGFINYGDFVKHIMTE
ncbi:myosin light polypeptide 6 [Silurus meridionalis]|uniref:myosin light polypeptide 6 n=1 Tax=Silurus meridionalis TaxID=175797 RepID=UPI001EEC55F4|nr:myosin light polypeptide 6 [Silurus meridionalis]